VRRRRSRVGWSARLPGFARKKPKETKCLRSKQKDLDGSPSGSSRGGLELKTTQQRMETLYPEGREKNKSRMNGDRVVRARGTHRRPCFHRPTTAEEKQDGYSKRRVATEWRGFVGESGDRRDTTRSHPRKGKKTEHQTTSRIQMEDRATSRFTNLKRRLGCAGSAEPAARDRKSQRKVTREGGRGRGDHPTWWEGPEPMLGKRNETRRGRETLEKVEDVLARRDTVAVKK